MSRYPHDSSYSSDGYNSPGGRPLSGAGMNPGFNPGGQLDSFQQPGRNEGGYSEGESLEVAMPYIGGDEERRNSLAAMGAMLRAGPPSDDGDKKKSKKKDKKDKDSGGGGGGRGLKLPKPPSIDVRGSFRKMKGKFSRGKDKEPLQHATSKGSIEFFEQQVMPDVGAIDPQTLPEITPPSSGYATPQQFDPHPGGYDINPTDTLPSKGPPSKMDSMKASVKGWFSPTSVPPPPPPSRYSPGDVAELKPMPGKYPIRMSTIIYFLLGLGILIGIILTAMGSNSHYSVVGPVFIGLSCFAIIGKVFFGLLWLDEPCPQLRPYITKVEDAVGGSKDPYRLKQPIQASPMYMPPMTPTAVPLSQFTYRHSYPPQMDPSMPPSGLEYPPPGVGYQPPYPPSADVGYNPPEYPHSMAYKASYDDEDYPEKVPLGNGETMDTKMGLGRSREALTKDYDGADTNEGHNGPAGRSTPTYHYS